MVNKSQKISRLLTDLQFHYEKKPANKEGHFSMETGRDSGYG